MEGDSKKIKAVKSRLAKSQVIKDDPETGAALVQEDQGIPMTDPSSGTVLFAKNKEEARAMMAMGIVPEGAEDNAQRRYYDAFNAPFTAAMLGAANTVSLGGFGYAVDKLVGEGTTAAFSDVNPTSTTFSEVGAAAAATIATGGLAAAGGARLAAMAGRGKVVQALGRLGIEGAIGGAAESAAQAPKSDDDAIGYVKRAIEGAGIGAALGVGLGASALGIGKAVSKFSPGGKSVLGSIAEKTKGFGKKYRQAEEFAELSAQRAEEAATLRQQIEALELEIQPIVDQRRTLAEDLGKRGEELTKARQWIDEWSKTQRPLDDQIREKSRNLARAIADVDPELAGSISSTEKEIAKYYRTPAKKRNPDDLASLQSQLDELLGSVPEGRGSEIKALKSDIAAAKAKRAEFEKANLKAFGGRKNTDVVRDFTTAKKQMRAIEETLRAKNIPLNELKYKAKSAASAAADYERQAAKIAQGSGFLGRLASSSISAMGGASGPMRFIAGELAGAMLRGAVPAAQKLAASGAPSALGAAARGVGAAARPFAVIGGARLARMAAHEADPVLSSEELYDFAREVHGQHDQVLIQADLAANGDPDYTAGREKLRAQMDYLKTKLPQPDPLNPGQTFSRKDRETAGAVASALYKPEGVLARIANGEASKIDKEVAEAFFPQFLDHLQSEALRVLDAAYRDEIKLDRKAIKTLSNIIGRKPGLAHPVRNQVLQQAYAKGGAQRLDMKPPAPPARRGREYASPSASSELEG